MTLLSGAEVAKKLQLQITQEVTAFTQSFGESPKLDVILVGDDSASQVYVKNKKLTCEKVGMIGEIHRLSASASENQVIELVEKLNCDRTVDGILVQLPLPAHMSADQIISHLDPLKDPDCLTPENVGLMWLGRPRSLSCTPLGIRDILYHYKVSVENRNAVIVGRSNIVGKPMAQILLDMGATVTICHSKTKNLREHTQKADIVVVAMGKPKALDKSYFNPQSIVIDVGIHRTADGLCGDVNFNDVKNYVAAITPVPGGVGPMTINSLIKNTLLLAKMRRETTDV